MKTIKVLYPEDEKYHPGVGRIHKQNGSDPNHRELEMVNWIYRNLGGNITVLKILDKNMVKTADIIFNNRKFDIKHTAGTQNTLDYHLRRAAAQTDGGGAFVDITGALYLDGDAVQVAIDRMQRSNLTEVYFIRSSRLVAHLISIADDKK